MGKEGGGLGWALGQKIRERLEGLILAQAQSRCSPLLSFPGWTVQPESASQTPPAASCLNTLRPLTKMAW